MAQTGEARALDMRQGGAQGAAQGSREPSMEDILASIKRIIEDTDGVRKPVDAGAEPDVGSSVIELHDADNDTTPGDVAPEASASGDVTAFRAELNAEPELPQRSQEVEQHSAPFAGVAEPARLHEEPARAAVRPSIISEVAGRQVAAAFNDLNDAFAASRKRTFDEIAEEMMRPMLQDWLDNNLPLLVERLVREEIERVARGGVR